VISVQNIKNSRTLSGDSRIWRDKLRLWISLEKAVNYLPICGQEIKKRGDEQQPEINELTYNYIVYLLYIWLSRIST
jgi:hypothetical protein